MILIYLFIKLVPQDIIRPVASALTLTCIWLIRYSVRPVYKGHSGETEIVPLMISCPLYTGQNYMHFSLKGTIWLPFKADLTVLMFKIYRS